MCPSVCLVLSLAVAPPSSAFPEFAAGAERRVSASESFQPQRPRLNARNGALMGAAFGGILLLAIATNDNDFDLRLRDAVAFVAVPAAIGGVIGFTAGSASAGVAVRVRF